VIRNETDTTQIKHVLDQVNTQYQEETMDWKASYQSRCTTLNEAVTHIHSGDRVVVDHACGEPSALLAAMTQNAEAYTDVEIVHMVAMGKALYAQPGMEKHFDTTNLCGAASRTRSLTAEALYAVLFSKFRRCLRQRCLWTWR
jgi:4-hydroxybutyrate CoA-transferase